MQAQIGANDHRTTFTLVLLHLQPSPHLIGVPPPRNAPERVKASEETSGS